jgi:SpoVK/Ycf46/Vps4 family AAA+-type ATPase
MGWGSSREAIQEGALDFDGVVSEIRKYVFEKFPYLDTKIVGILMEYLRSPESIEDLRNVKPADRLNYLIGLVHLLHLAGFRMIYLFIDQLEMGWGKWSRIQKDRFAIDVRELVVRTKPLLSVEVTCNEDIISDLETNYPQLLRPLPKKLDREIYVGPFNLPAVKKLIDWYFDKKRMDKSSAGLAPFDEEAIKEIYDRTARITFDILSACHGLLNYAAQHEIKLITKEMVIEHLPEVMEPYLRE